MRVAIPRVEVQPVSHCTLACVGCQHFSPQRPDETLKGRDYLGHLTRLWEFAEWGNLFVGGGEPFLHPGLATFLDVIHSGPWGRRRPDLITNGFWLLRRDWRGFATGVLLNVSALVVSRYPLYVDRLGVAEWDRRLDVLRRDFPGLAITSFHPSDPSGLTFTQNRFHDEPRRPLDPPACSMRRCLQLLPDGRLAKCPLGRAIDLIPNATDAFRAEYRRSSYYDIARGGEGFAEFVGPDLHPACSYCGIATGDTWDTPWLSDRKVASARGSDYLAIIGQET